MSPLAVRRMLVRLSIIAGLVLAACKGPAHPPPLAPAVAAVAVAPTMDAIVTDFRGVIALLADEPGAETRRPPSPGCSPTPSTIGWKRWARASPPSQRQRRRSSTSWRAMPAFHDADKLAFRDLLSELPPSARTDKDSRRARRNPGALRRRAEDHLRPSADARHARSPRGLGGVSRLRAPRGLDRRADQGARRGAGVRWPRAGAAARCPGATTRTRSPACASPRSRCC